MGQKREIWIGLIVFLLVLIILISAWKPTSIALPETTGFPLALWLVVFVPLWSFRAYLEIAGKFDDKKAWCVTLNMASIFSMIATIAIFILQGTTPNWWNNITGSGTGKFFLFALIPLIFLVYILPGTGSGTVKWGKKIAVVLGIFIFLGLLGAAIGGGISSKKVYREVYASVPIQAPTPVVAPAWTLFAEKTVTADDWQEIAVADKTTFYKYRCDGDCENTKIKAGYAELPANSGHTLLISAGEKIYAKGGGTIKVCRRG